MEGGEEGESEFLFRRPIILSADIITKMDRRDKGKKKKDYKSEYLFRDSDLDLSTFESSIGGTVEHTEEGGGSVEGRESYGALMRILPKDRSPAIMIHEFDVQRIVDAPCYVIVSQLTTRIPWVLECKRRTIS